MSGGHFDYIQHEIDSTASRLEEELVCRDAFMEARSPETLESLRLCARTLREAAIRLHRADWLLSGDDGEEQYHKRLADDLTAI